MLFQESAAYAENIPVKNLLKIGVFKIIKDFYFDK